MADAVVKKEQTPEEPKDSKPKAKKLPKTDADNTNAAGLGVLGMLTAIVARRRKKDNE